VAEGLARIPATKVAGFDFDGFKVSAVSAGEVCPAVITPEDQACMEAGGRGAAAKDCQVLCSVPIAPRGKVAGYDFDGPKVLASPSAGIACPAVITPEQMACERVGGTSKAANNCAVLCSKPIVQP
jgi:hypothetical protein